MEVRDLAEDIPLNVNKNHNITYSFCDLLLFDKENVVERQANNAIFARIGLL